MCSRRRTGNGGKFGPEERGGNALWVRLLFFGFRLDVLCLNAGRGGAWSKELTSEGLELVMATNHFGHFLLVNLLSGLKL